MTYVIMYVKPYTTEKEGLTWTRLVHSGLYRFSAHVQGDKPITDNLYVTSDGGYMVFMTQEHEEVEDMKTLLWSPPVQGVPDV